MKAILVDDEKLVREAIRMLVDWQRFGVTEVLEAANGEQAIALIRQHQPALIFLDMMMPVKSGPELLEWIHFNAQGCKTIVISGHDDFKLVRHTLKFGGMDYLLKPIDPDLLGETVQRAVDRWREDEQKRMMSARRDIEVNQLKPVYWDKFFSNLVLEPALIGTEKPSLLQEFGLSDAEVPCRLAILSLEELDGRLYAKFSSRRDLLFYSLTNICNEYLQRSKAGYAFRYWNSDKQILLLFWRETEAVESILDEINQGIRQSLGAVFHFGVGSVQPFPNGLGQSYKTAALALKQRNLLDLRTHVHLAAKEQDKIPVIRFNDHLDEVRLAIRSGSSDQIRLVVDQMLAPFSASHRVTPVQLENWWHEYTLFLSQWIQEFVKESEAQFDLPDIVHPFKLPLNASGSFSLEPWRDELASALASLAKLKSEHEQKKNNVVYEIAKYIQKNYHQDLTLQDIANHFYLGREYISRRFKQDTGENISDYIGRIRMDKAKALLLNPNLRIVKIAEMVGFQDEKYFSKVFKKHTGMTPNEYRKEKNRSPAG